MDLGEGSKTQLPWVNSQGSGLVFDSNWMLSRGEEDVSEDLKREKARKREAKQRRERKRKEVSERERGVVGFFEV